MQLRSLMSFMHVHDVCMFYTRACRAAAQQALTQS